MKHFSIIILIFVSGLFASAQTKIKSEAAQKAEADILIARLDSCSTASDSLKVLYDVFDVLPTSKKSEVGWKILDVAERSWDQDAAQDILRQLSVLQVRNKSALDSLYLISERLPDGEDKKSTQLFINVQRAMNEVSYLSPEERQKVLLKYVKEDLTPKNDLYDNILDLYRVVLFMRYSSQGNMYMEYLSRLEDMIDQLPAESKYLKNAFYTTAATYYTNHEFQEKAIECDRKLLEIIKDLEKHYAESGRQYRNLDRFYYICYRRMLSNYGALSLDEVKDLYAKCSLLAQQNEEVGTSFANDGRATAYRLMAEKDYAGAIPYLKSALKSIPDRGARTLAVTRLIEAADSANDQASLLSALKMYNTLLSESRKSKVEEAVIELQMRYNVNHLKNTMAEMALEKKDIELGSNQKVISITLISLFVVVLFLMFLYRSHFRLLSQKRQLEEEKEKLKQTIDELLNDGTPQGTQDLRDQN